MLGPTLLAALACVSCASSQRPVPNNTLTAVWTQSGWPPEALSAPPLFQLTPREAYAIVAQSKQLSLKHPWVCFRDERCYYIADTFGRRVRAKTALTHGFRVDGRTGALAPP